VTVRGTVGKQYASVAKEFGIEADPGRLEAAFRAVSRSSAPIGYPAGSIEQTASAERRWWRDLVGEVFSRAGSLPPSVERFDRFFDQLFLHFGSRSAWEVFGDVAPALETLAGRGIASALVTNFDLRVWPLLQSTGLERFFPVVAIPATTGCQKPDPGIFEAALGELGLGAEEVAHVGDSIEHDIRVASELGMKAIWLDRRNRPAAPGILRLTTLADLMGLDGLQS